MAKRYHDPEYSGNLDQNRRQEERDGAIMNPKANTIPESVMIKDWITVGCQGTGTYDDSPEGIDSFISSEKRKAKLGK